MALDTTGSSVIPVGEELEPLDDYYLWCDHRAYAEARGDHAERRTSEASKASNGAEACIRTSGDSRSCCTGCGTILRSAAKLVTALEHCDMVAATLCGITKASDVKRSVCAMGHKWMWNPKWGGLPPEEFLVAVDPLLARRARQAGRRVPDQRSNRRPSFAGVGGRVGIAAPGFRFRWARSTRTGTRSARVSAKAMW